MNKYSLKGNPAELWGQRAYKVTKAQNALFVEYVYRIDLTQFGRGVIFERRAVGINGNGIGITGHALEDGKFKDYYYWQCCTKTAAIEKVLNNPSSVYDYELTDF